MSINSKSNQKQLNWKVKVQKFGGVMSAMVMPNIGAFIAWGLITSFFIPTGWIPNEYLAGVISPSIIYMLPLLIAYTGGTNIYGGRRGGVIGAIATMGIIVGSDQPMLAGAMLMGALGAWGMKKIDNLFKGKVKPGLEMLVDNFSLGIYGAVLMLAGYIAIGPIFSTLTAMITKGVDWLTQMNLLPFTAILVAPAQVLFLNNAINHGIMVPIGIQQVMEAGRSIMFLVEANVGTWLGLILAFCIYGKGAAKRSAPAAAGILFFGGIGEVVFPYALMKPAVVLGPMLSNIASLFLLQLLHGGTVGAVSPGSFPALLMMTPKGAFAANIAACALATTISFLVVAFILKRDKSPEESKVTTAVPVMTAVTSDAVYERKVKEGIEKVTIVCDAGMGSSAMGLSILKTKCSKAMLDLTINNVSVDHVPQDADIIITNKVLEERVREKLRNEPLLLTIENFLDNNEWDRIVGTIKKYSV